MKNSILMGLILSVSASAGAATDPLPPLPLPNLDLVTNGTVSAVAARPGGGIVFGGVFTEVNGVARANLARLNADGSLDMQWAPNTASSVSALAVAADDTVYAGGSFFQQGVTMYTEKFSGSGAGDADAGWFSIGSPGVSALVLDGQGSLYVGGSFGNGSVENLAKASATDGRVDYTWNPGLDRVYAMAFDGDHHLYVAGGGGVAKVSIDGQGAVDTSWAPFRAGADAKALAFDSATGRIFVGGWLCPTDKGLQCRHYAKVSTSGDFDAQWDPAVEGSDDGAIGPLSTAANGFLVAVVTHESSEAVRISPTGTGVVDAQWHPLVDGRISALAAASGGSVWFGGTFGHVAGGTRRGLARVDSAGQVEEPRSNATSPGVVNALVVQPDQHVVVGGEFSYDEETGTRTNLIRLRPDGRIDAQWSANTDGVVRTLASDGEGAIYVGGAFETIGGVARRNLAKVGPGADGVIDPAWNPSPATGLHGVGVSHLATYGSHLFVGGDFNVIGAGAQRNGLARISMLGEGLADPDWAPPVYAGDIDAMAVGPDGALYVAGTLFGMSDMGKIGADGVVDGSWLPSPDGPVKALYVDRESNVFTAGDFTSVGGANQRRLAKLSSIDGAADLAWRPLLTSPFSSFWDRWPTSATITPDGADNLLVAGTFDSVDGVAACYVAKLSIVTGNVAPDWNPCPSDGVPPHTTPFPSTWLAPVKALAVRSDGSVIAGGNFERMSGFTRNGLAALPPEPLPELILVDGFESD